MSKHIENFWKGRDFDDWENNPFRTLAIEKLKLITNPGIIQISSYPLIVSIKDDGRNVRIIKHGDTIRFLSSGHGDFYHKGVACWLVHMPDGQLNTEMIAGDGSLGTRIGCGCQTTAITDYNNDHPNLQSDWYKGRDISFKVFDFIAADDNEFNTYDVLAVRKNALNRLFTKRIIPEMPCISESKSIKVYSLSQLKKAIKDFKSEYPKIEGVVIQSCMTPYQESKVNGWKIKYIEEGVGVCYDVELDQHGRIGTLLLNHKGNEVKVSSGIDDEIRDTKESKIIGKEVEFEYEYVTADGCYSQARIKRII